MLETRCRVGVRGVRRSSSMRRSDRRSRPSVVCTDPPYYDNIGYADLSDFFYVWLRRSLGGDLPGSFQHAADAEGAGAGRDAVPLRWRPRAAEQFFEEGLGEAFERMREAQHPDYPLTLFYAFKQAETTRRSGRVDWLGDDARRACSTAGFAVTGTWPMRTELRQPNASDRHERARLVDRARLPPAARRRADRDAPRASSPRSARSCPRRCAAPARQHRAGRPRAGGDRARDGGLLALREGARGGRLADDRPLGACADQPGARRDPRRAGGRLRRRHALRGRLGSSSTASTRAPFGEADDARDGEEHVSVDGLVRGGHPRSRARARCGCCGATSSTVDWDPVATAA